MAGRPWNHKNHYIRTVDLFILARYRDRTVSDRSLSSTVHGLTSVTVHRPPFTVHRSPFTVHRSPFTVHRPLFNVHRSPFSVHRFFKSFINKCFDKIFQKKYF